jgi:hypothetical protein
MGCGGAETPVRADEPDVLDADDAVEAAGVGGLASSVSGCYNLLIPWVN